jgi:hypothetical protein
MRVASRTGRNDAMLERAATDALRSRSPEKLEASIRDLLSGPDNAGLREDSRDLMVALAPLHDCARRLGVDPAAVFDAAAEGASPETAQLAREFGRRTDVNGHSFAFMVEDTDEGPEYWHVPFGVDLKQIPREEREEFLARRTAELERWLEEDQAP